MAEAIVFTLVDGLSIGFRTCFASVSPQIYVLIMIKVTWPTFNEHLGTIIAYILTLAHSEFAKVGRV